MAGVLSLLSRSSTSLCCIHDRIFTMLASESRCRTGVRLGRLWRDEGPRPGRLGLHKGRRSKWPAERDCITSGQAAVFFKKSNTDNPTCFGSCPLWRLSTPPLLEHLWLRIWLTNRTMDESGCQQIGCRYVSISCSTRRVYRVHYGATTIERVFAKSWRACRLRHCLHSDWETFVEEYYCSIQILSGSGPWDSTA